MGMCGDYGWDCTMPEDKQHTLMNSGDHVSSSLSFFSPESMLLNECGE